MAHDVFISYSSKDKPIADGICAHLEAATVRCWIAPRDIEPGDDWPTAISKAITQSKIMVLVFSASSNSSEDVSREVNLAANNKVVIIPFKIENVEPKPGINYYLSRTHWLDAMNPPTQEQIQLLIERTKKLLAPETSKAMPTQTATGDSPKPSLPSNKRKLNPWWIGVSLLILLMVGVVMCVGSIWLGKNLLFAKPGLGTPTLDYMMTSTYPAIFTDTPQFPATKVPNFSPTNLSLQDSPQPATQVISEPAISVDVKRISYLETQVLNLAWMPDSKQVVLAGFELQPYDVVSQTATTPTDKRVLDDVAISPDGDLVAVATTWEGIQLFDHNWSNLGTLPMSSDGHSVVFTPDGKKILAGEGNLVKIWDASNIQELPPIPFDDRVDALAISPDGKTLAVSLLMEIKLLSIDGEELFSLKGHGHQIFALAFSPDGKILASGSLDNTIRFWDATTGRMLRILNGHTKAVNSVAFSPDGKCLASGSDDTKVKVWDVGSATELQTLYDHTESVTSVAFSPDGTMLATGSYDKMQLWSIVYTNP
jgi:hypothetical protein